MRRILVSGCLNGPPIRFNETAVTVESVIWEAWREEGRLVAFCPELGAGFPVPRAPAEIVSSSASQVLVGRGVVQEDDGTDVTEMFIRGAELAVERAVESGCVAAVLTDGSPSCGTTYVYDGEFTGATIPGRGVAAQLLAEHGIVVYAESQLAEADRYVRSTPESGEPVGNH